MPSFGYSSGSGSHTFTTGVAVASAFTNTTGATVYVDTLTLVNVTGGAGAHCKLAIYSDASNLGDLALYLLGSTAAVVVAAGSNAATILGDPIAVGPGVTVWAAMLIDANVACSSAGATALLTPAAAGSGNYSNGFASQFISEATKVNAILPVTLSGSNTGPGHTTDLRVPLVLSEPLTEGAPDLRVPLMLSEPLTEGVSALRGSLMLSEPLTEGYDALRSSLIIAETLHAIPEEPEMVTDIFPTLPGLTWDVTKTPNFNTQVRKSTSNKAVRNPLAQFPIWTFKVGFEFLRNNDGSPNVALGTTELKYLMGFFCKRGGKDGLWLFKDPTDYSVTGGAIDTGDGVTLQFPFYRVMGPWTEPVGQVDTLTKFSFPAADVNAGTDTITKTAHGYATGDGPFFIATTGGAPAGLAVLTPYWIIAPTANTFKLATSAANALAGTQIDITSQGTGTHSLTGGWAVYDNGTLQTSAQVSLFGQNQIVFVTAPVAGHAITATFKFWFVCSFLTDSADFNNWADKLWDLQQLTFESNIT